MGWGMSDIIELYDNYLMGLISKVEVEDIFSWKIK